MNNLIKLGVAGSLVLGSLGAQAAITVGTSSGGSLGDAVLFADVFSGTTLVKAFVGDTGYTLAQLQSGTTGSFKDANLATFLASAGSGTTVDWLVAGAGSTGGSSNPSPTVLTSTGGTVAATISSPNGLDLQTVISNFNTALGPINGHLTGGLNSFVGTDDSSLSGNDFAPFGTTIDASNLFNQVGQVATKGLGTSKLYQLTAADEGGSQASINAILNVSLDTTNGLTFSALQTTTPVPIPAAVWLFGSGLLGLAGVSRRKIAAV